MARLRPGNATAYDAFYSVPQGISRQISNTSGHAFPMSAMMPGDEQANPGLPSSYQLSSLGSFQQHEDLGPWDSVARSGTSAAIAIHHGPSSHRSTSPTDPSSSGSVPFDLPRATSPSAGFTTQRSSADSRSSSSGSNSGRSSGNVVTDDEMSRAVNGLAVSTHRGNTSPQLPSPASGASSGGSTRNGVDQNPPVSLVML